MGASEVAVLAGVAWFVAEHLAATLLASNVGP